MAEFTLTECTRQNTCHDCENERCCLAGKKKSDCPKYHCDNPNGTDDCDHCAFIDDYIEHMRKSYKAG